MSDEKKLRCIPQQLSMNEAAPVCQHWCYASDHAMKSMLDGDYFLSAYDRLRPGDTIRIVQMAAKNIHARDNNVVAFSNVTILNVNNQSIGMSIDRQVVLGESGKGRDVETENMSGQAVDESIKTSIEELQNDVSEIAAGHNELVSQVNNIRVTLDDEKDASPDDGSAMDTKSPEFTAGEKAVVKWNPGKREHEVIVGEDERIVFAHKKKDEVETWLQKSGLSTAQE